MRTLIKERINGFGEFEFYEGYFIGRIDEGVDASFNFVDSLSKLIQRHFSNQPVIYISDRVNSYSLDPVATMDLIARNNICFAGVVIYTKLKKQVFSFEEETIKGISMFYFDDLESAMIWAEQKLLKPN